MKSKKILTIILTGLLASACQSGGVQPDTGAVLKLDQKISINGLEREYHIFIPENPANKPLVILLHGHGGSFDQSMGFEASKAPQKVWLDLAEEQNFIVIIPNGVIGPDEKRGWNDCRSDATSNPDSDDVRFINELIDNTKDEYDLNDKRVYVAGVSNGASMSIRLAQEIPEKISAFASVVSQMPVNSECTDSNVPVSALFMNGTDDPIVPYEGGQIISDRGEVESTDNSIDYWMVRNGTDTVATKQAFDNINTSDSSTVEKYVYASGVNNTEVVLYKVIGGGHTEPSLEERYRSLYLAVAGKQNGDIEMANEVWDFFRTKSK